MTEGDRGGGGDGGLVKQPSTKERPSFGHEELMTEHPLGEPLLVMLGCRNQRFSERYVYQF